MPNYIYKFCCSSLVYLFSIPVFAMENVEVTSAWINQPPPGVTTVAGYMNIQNTRETPIILTGASSPVFTRIEFHLSRENNGVVSMQKVESIEIAPGETFSFSPGQYHLMLFLAEESMETGSFIPITLEFSGQESIEIKAVLRRGLSHHQH